MKEKIVKHCSDCQHCRVCGDVCFGDAGAKATHCWNFDEDYGSDEDESTMEYKDKIIIADGKITGTEPCHIVDIEDDDREAPNEMDKG